mmetsp:Transcript_34356/g.39141  ORF Transcript_34356/g.39141 Transcript_34356/m.39141 type:complete len:263 (-) Transcript_34356:12-800(-)
MSSSAQQVFRKIVHSRRSVRRFIPKKTIDDDILKDILESSMRSPSSFNLQPTQIILVQDDDIKKELAEKCMLGMGNQYRTRDAPVVAVFLSDLEVTKRISRIEALEKDTSSRDPNYLNMLPIAASFLAGEGHAATFLKQVSTDFLSFNNKSMPCIEPVQAWSYKNTSLLGQTYMLAASSYGIGTCIMEGMDGRKVKEILRIPDRYAIPFAIATGYDYDNETKRTPRLDLNEICFRDSFGIPLTFDDTNEDDDDDKSSSKKAA